MPEEGRATDPYAAPKANIRETVKWMAAAYIAAVAVLIAGAPFSNLGSLPNWHLFLVLAGGAVTLVLFFYALNEVLKFLIGDDCFPSGFDSDTTQFVDHHRDDLLPARFGSYNDFLAERTRVQSDVRTLSRRAAAPLPPAEGEVVQQQLRGALAALAELDGFLAPLVSFAHLYVLRRGVDRLRRRLAVATLVAVIALVGAVWAATPPKPESEPKGKRAAAAATLAAACSPARALVIRTRSVRRERAVRRDRPA
jgi:hypothetical protein